MTPDERFDLLMTTLTRVIHGLDYYVNWNNVTEQIKKHIKSLYFLNYLTLVSENNIQKEFKNLIKRNPEIVEVLPLLLGISDTPIEVNSNRGIYPSQIDEFNFKNNYDNLNDRDKKQFVNNYTRFVTKTGLLDFISNNNITSLLDYSYGVRVGSDTNGRKNRSGDLMENQVEDIIKSNIRQSPIEWEYLSQVTSTDIFNKWNLNVGHIIEGRKIDFVLLKEPNSPILSNLIFIEVNFYSTQGSKLHTVCKSMTELNSLCNEHNTRFIWITDGKGWESVRNPFRNTFNSIDHIFNLHMINNDYLQTILNE
jgi:type II restriction enzyme